MKTMPKDKGVLHFVGIGGIGMSGLAEILHDLEYRVQGSDMAENANVKRLRDKGIRVEVGHDAKNIDDESGQPPVAVVISSAIKSGNTELDAARARKIPVLRRADMLAELMRLKWSVAISGTHGKTTTTSMVGHMMEVAGFDPTVINGGIVNSYGTNVRRGASDLMVVEADESDGTFTRLPATIAVVTNMDAEHMDHYGSFDRVKEAYKTFVTQLPFYGFAVLCIDHPEVQALVPSVQDRRIITYGMNPQADVQASNIEVSPEGCTFDVRFAAWLSSDGKESHLKDVHLSMLGRHNVQNALAALAIAKEMDVPAALMKKALSTLTGVKRRFTKTGEVKGITIIDDYAHHPVEIETVLKTARDAVADTGGNVIAVMQPHRYSRLHDLFDEFCTCFNHADQVLIADIYAAGEDPIDGASQEALVAGIQKHGHKNVSALESRDQLASRIAEATEQGDFVILMGAGDITAWAYALPGELEKHLESKVA